MSETGVEQVDRGGGGTGKRAKRKKGWVREYAEALVVAAILVMVIRTFLFQAFRIPSGSMEDTLLIGDFLFVNKAIYGAPVPFTESRLPGFGDPDRGDIVVFKFPKDLKRDFIKRIVGTPGDTVEVRAAAVYVNGELQDEPFVKLTAFRPPPGDSHGAPMRNPRDAFGPVVVPEGHYFVMGDNRDQSDDSRYWGFLDGKLIKGKAMFIYFSWNADKTLPRFGRIGRILR